MQPLTSRSNQSQTNNTIYSSDPSIQYKYCLKSEDLLCTKCMIRKRNHYCIESECPHKRLLCVPCDCEDPTGEHYTHAVAYVLPLLTNNVSRNIEEVFQGLNSFREMVETQIVKIQSYIQNLSEISVLISRMLDSLNQQKQFRRLEVFENAMSKVLKQKSMKSFKLDEVFQNINFITNEECRIKADAFKKQLLNQVTRLNWLPDPQKLLRDALFEKDDSLIHKPEYVFSVSNSVEITQIDSHFRNYYQLLSDKLKYNPVLIKLQNEYSNKTKLYEVLMYHFRKCRYLTIHNTSLNQIKTPLSFRDLKQLQFECNPDYDSNTLRFQGISNLSSLRLKKLKEQDTKSLKTLRQNLPYLKQLTLQFFNKYDMSINKQLIEFFTGEDNNLRRIVLKLRTQSQVKRLYGHFTKFLKQVGQVTLNQPSLQQAIMGYLDRHKNNLTRITLEGVKISNQQKFINIIQAIPNLIELKVTQINTPSLNDIFRRLTLMKKSMAIIQRVYKRSQKHRCNDFVLDNIIRRAIWN